MNPAPLGHPDLADAHRPANYDDDLELLRGCDLVIEAIAERMDWKHDLYRKVAHRSSAPTRSSRPTHRACRSGACPKASMQAHARGSAACTSSIRRATCIWWN
jgi:hypothetical protein